jgi:hypothetical protein
MLFARLDTFGNVIDYKIYNDSLGDDFTLVYPNSFIKLSDGSGYAGVGQLFYRESGCFVKFDNTGNLKVFKEYVDTLYTNNIFNQIIESGNSFLIGGTDFDWAANSTNVNILKIDSAGSLLWEKKNQNPNVVNLFGSIMKIDGNNFIITSSTTTKPGIVDIQHTKNTSKIFAIDSLGNIKWQWESQPSLVEMGAGQIYETPDHNWLYSSACAWYDAMYNVIYLRPTTIIRDTNFNLIRTDTFGVEVSNTQYFANLLPMQDHGWLALGTMPVAYGDGVQPDAYNALSGWFIRFDSTATPVWSRVDTAFWSTQSGSTNYLYDAVELPSGSIIACGYSRTYEPAGKDWGWLVKISPDGCVDTLSCATLQAPVHLLPEALVSIYPNPATSWLHIESQDGILWDKIELLDMSGRVLQTLYSVAEHRMDVSGLAAGLYVLRLTKAQQSVTKKVVKRP